MKPETGKDYRERVLRVLVHIQQNLDEALDLESLAALAHFSPYHFHRVFRGMVGESLEAHVRRLRLERAAHQLEFTDKSVTRIAFAAGYGAHESFTRAFKKALGLAPSRYRDLNRGRRFPEVANQIHFQGDDADVVFRPALFPSTEDVTVESRPAQRVAFVRHVGPYSEVGEVWQRLMTWAGSQGLFRSPVTLVGLAHDDPETTVGSKLRYDACVPVAPWIEGAGEVGIQEIRGGDHAMALHRGSYETFADTYNMLFGGWLPTTAREPADAPCIEIYRNDPRFVPADDLLTEIRIPLQ